MKIEKYKKIMIQVLLIETIGIMIGFMFILKPKAEMLSYQANVSYVSPTNQNNIYYNYLIPGASNRFTTLEIRQGMSLEYYVLQYTYRMSDLKRKYNVYFVMYSSKGTMGTITLNNQPCEIYENFRIDGNTNGLTNGQLFNVACINIDPDLNSFELVVRQYETWNPYANNLYGIKDGFYVSSYPSEEQALNNAMSDLANAINTNQTDNTNRVINSVNNMTNQLLQKQDEWQNTDLDNNTKQNADTTQYNTTIGKEEDIIDSIGNIDENQIQISLNPSTSNWIWETLTRLIQSNTIVFSTLISILSIGVIKLILRR